MSPTDLEKIKAYIDSFRFGAYPHGGGGIGKSVSVCMCAHAYIKTTCQMVVCTSLTMPYSILCKIMYLFSCLTYSISLSNYPACPQVYSTISNGMKSLDGGRKRWPTETHP